MRRREFIALLGVAAIAWPLAARAQQPAMPVVGFLHTGSRVSILSSYLSGFEEGLRQTGYVEGKNITIEFRDADGRNDRLPSLAAELARGQVALIFASDNAAAVAAKAAAGTIPIVFWIGGDPVKLGLVASLARPGGNITGVSGIATMVVAKRLQLLHDMAPNVRSFGILTNPANPQAEADVAEAQAAALALGLQLDVLKAGSADEVDAAFATLAERGVGALVIEGDPFLRQQNAQLIRLAARQSVPAIFTAPVEAARGALMSYGTDIGEQYREAAIYVGRILKGENPANLPVQQGTKLLLKINRKTADSLGLAIPPSLYNFADEVIE
jgi:putative tryptophan/tyrosine transport system substrate-binding protein